MVTCSVSRVAALPRRIALQAWKYLAAAVLLVMLQGVPAFSQDGNRRFCRQANATAFLQWRSWLRGVDLNHRPLGYEGWQPKSLVRNDRESLLDS
jgi:hypothetical protein